MNPDESTLDALLRQHRPAAPAPDPYEATRLEAALRAEEHPKHPWYRLVAPALIAASLAALVIVPLWHREAKVPLSEAELAGLDAYLEETIGSFYAENGADMADLSVGEDWFYLVD